jgi:hypothetical protein
MRDQSGKKGSKRAYILLDVSYGKLESVTRALRSLAGVVLIDILEGPPDIIMALEATERLFPGGSGRIVTAQRSGAGPQ